MTSNEMILVQRAKNGDANALVEIYETNQPTIYTYVFYRVGDVHLAEDLTAEVFVRMIHKLKTYQPNSRPILAWLYTIAHNLVVDHYRENGKATWTELKEDQSAIESDVFKRSNENCLAQIDLVHALKTLTEEQRLVIVLKFIEGRKNIEIAEILNKSEGAIKSLQHRALNSLKRALENDEEYYEYENEFQH